MNLLTKHSRVILVITLSMLTSLGLFAQVDVTASGGTATASYPTLKGAFDAINAGTHTNVIQISITGTVTETATASLNASGSGSASYTGVTINPVGNAVVTGNLTLPLVELNGADNVVIDGLNTGGNSLTISNTNTSATSGTCTIKLIGDATNNTITNSIIQGSATMSTTANGGTIFISTAASGGNGNDNNTISNNDIGASPAGTPTKGIYGNGSTTNLNIANSGINITNNNIHDIFLASGAAAFIYVNTGNTQWNISQNKLYQTTSRAFTGTSSFYYIYFGNSTYGEGVTIENNKIGYAAADGTGTTTYTGTGASVYGINTTFNSSASLPCNVNGNTIANFACNQSGSGSFYGILNSTSSGSSTLNFNNNTIQNISSSTTGAFYGISWGSGFIISLSGNTIKDISKSASATMYGMYSGSSSYTEQVNNNNVFNFTTTATSSSTLYGIYQLTTTTGTKSYNNNKVYNFNGSGGATIYGLRVGYGYDISMSNNEVHDLNSTGGTSATIYPYYISSSVYGGKVSKNKGYNFSTSGSTGVCYGIYLSTSSTALDVYNNMIGNLNSTAYSSTTAPYLSIAGIYVSAGTVNLYNNTVFIPASSTSSGTNASAAAVYASTSATLLMQNNLLVNRSVPKGLGKSIAYGRSSTTLTSYASASNNNSFLGTSGIFWDGTNFYPDLVTYKPAIGGRDVRSVSVNPVFVSETGVDAGYLHIPNSATPNLLESGGILVPAVATDFDGDARPGPAGSVNGGAIPDFCDIGADEFDGSPSLTCTTPTPGNTIASANAICFGQSTILSVQNPPAVQETGYTYQWQSSSDGITYSDISGANAATYTVVPAAVTYYQLLVTCANGPVTVASAPLLINFAASVLTTTPGSICGTGSATLQATTSAGSTPTWYAAATGGAPLATGNTFNTPTISANTNFYVSAESLSAGSAVLGTGTSSNSSSSTVGAAFGTYYGNGRAQVLVLASELSSAGLRAGNISAASINITSVGSPATLAGYTMKMMATSATSLTSFQSGTFTTVFGPDNYAVTVGTNTLTFSTPFVWDGVSNIIIDYCFGAGSSGSSSSVNTYTATSFYSFVNYQSDSNSDACNSTTTSNSYYYNRPNFTLVGQVSCGSGRVPVLASSTTAPGISISPANPVVCPGNSIALTASSSNAGYSYTWMPGNLTGASQNVSPAVNTTYTVSAFDAVSGCSTVESVDVTVSKAPIAQIAASSNNVCSGSEVTLTASDLNQGLAAYNFSAGTGGTLDPMTGATNVIGSGNDDTPAAPSALPFAFKLDGVNYANFAASPDGWIMLTNGTTTPGSQFSNSVISSTNTPKIYALWDDLATGSDGNVSYLVTGLAPNRIFKIQWNVTVPRNTSGAANSKFQVWLYEGSNNIELRYGSVGTTSSGSAGITVGSANYQSITYSSNTSSATAANDNNTVAPASGTIYSFTPPVYTYSWSDGTNTIGSGSSPTINVLPGGTTSYTVTIENSYGCQNTSAPVSVTILPVPAAPSTFPSAQCGEGIPTAYAIGAGAGQHYNWYTTSTGGSPLAGENSFVLGAYSINTTTTFYVSVADATCESPRTPVLATVNAPDAISIIPSSTVICLQASLTLDVQKAAGSNNYVYSWDASPASGSGLAANTQGASITITPVAAGNYTYTVEGVDGACHTSYSVSVLVNDNPVIDNATVTPATAVCSGTTVHFAASSLAAAAGVATIGTGTGTTSTTGISPFSNYWEGARSQYLVLASELQAAQLVAGNITSLSFNVTSTATNYDLSAYTIKIANTANTSLSGYGTPSGSFTTVFGPTTIPAPGIGTRSFTFTTPFVWDGVSNILVDICHDNDPTGVISGAYGSTNSVSYSVTSFNSVYGSYDDDAQSCGVEASYSVSTYNNRPNMQFGGMVGTDFTSQYNFEWNPGAIAGSSIDIPVYNSGTYTVKATNPLTGCYSTRTVDVIVNQPPPTPSGGFSLQCGTGIPTAEVYSASGAASPVFNWYDENNVLLQTGTSTTYLQPISSSINFNVSELSADGCESEKTIVQVYVIEADQITASASASPVCVGSPVTLSYSQTGSSNTYNFSWSASPESGSGITNPASATGPITITPTQAGTFTYTLNGEDLGSNCYATSTVVVEVKALPVITSVVASPVPPVCAGENVNLTADIAVIGPGTVTIGAGALVTTTSDSYTGNNVSPFSHYYGGFKAQYLVKASELQAANLMAGNLTSLALQVTSAGSYHDNFAVSLAQTSLTSLSSSMVTTGLSTVYTNASEIPVVGTNTYNFSTPFAWDGTSNILVQICWSDLDYGGDASEVAYDNTSYVSESYYRTDNTAASTICSYSSTTGTTSSRPQFVFGGTTNSSAATNYNWAWTWSGGSATGNTISVQPQLTTVYSVVATDAMGCSSDPAATITVNVNPLPLLPNVTNSVQCGVGIPAASVSGAGNGTGIFTWYDAATGGNVLQTGTNNTYLQSISNTTTFYVSEQNGTTGCEGPRAAVVATVNQPDAITAMSTAASVCIGSSFDLSVSKAGNTQTYVYSWEVTSANAATSGVSGTPTGPSINAVTPTAAGVYTYRVTGVDASLGCTIYSDVTVTVNALPQFTSVSASPSVICAGAPVTLSAVAPPTVTATLGTGTSTTSTTGVTPFANLWEGSRSQYLVLASELSGAGLTAGPITSLAFNVSSTSNTRLMNAFSIKIANTANTSLAGAYGTPVGSFTNCYGPVDEMVNTTGVKTFSFTTPFVWDGVSNILVDVCHDNDVDGTCASCYSSNSSVYYTATSFNSVFGSYADNAQSCGTQASSSVSSTYYTYRPNMVFGKSNQTITWNPGNITGSSVVVNPTISTNYVATVLDNGTGCSNTSSPVSVTVVPLTCSPIAVSGPTCKSKSFTLTVGANGSAGLNYSWSDGVTATVYPNAATISANLPIGNYNFTVVISSPCGETCTQTLPITVHELPSLSISGNPSFTVCGPTGSTTLTASGATTYSWSPAAGLSATTGSTVTASPTVNTNYTITGTDDNGCTSTVSQNIVVGPGITVNPTAVADVICSGGNAQLAANAVVSGKMGGLVKTYAFATDTNGALDAMAGATQAIGSSDDDTPSGVLPIGFGFYFEGNYYTDFSVSPDGFMKLGSTASSSQFSNSLTSTTNVPKLAPWWDDLATGTTGSVKYLLSGTAPNRILKVQWYVTIPRNTTGAANSTYQVWLYEGTNVVEFRYGTAGGASSSASVGLSGFTSTASNYMSVNASNVASTTTANNSLTVFPAAGRRYIFTPVQALSYTWTPSANLSSATVASPMANNLTNTTEFTVVAKDAVSGCSATGTVTVTVNTAPVFTTCPANMSVNTDAGLNTAVVNYTPVITGQPNPGVSYSFSGATTGSGTGDGSGSVFTRGVTTVTLTAHNTCSPDAVCSFTITVVDNEPPVITQCAPDQDVNLGNACEFVVPDLTGAITASDNSGIANVKQSPLAGTVLSLSNNSTQVVTITVTDISGLTASCNVTLTAKDVTPPVITQCVTDQNVNMGGKCSITIPDLTSMVVFSDNCGATITQSPLPNSEVSAGHNAPVTVTFTVTDAAGNQATCSTTLTAIDNVPPVIIICAEDQDVNMTSGCSIIVPDLTGDVGAGDNCGFTLTQSPAAGTVLSATNNATFPVVITATDAAGLFATCTATLTAKDVTVPVIGSCPPNRNVNLDAGSGCTLTVPNLVPELVVSDNCGSGTVTVTQSPAAGTHVSTTNNGTVIVTLTATDANNNSTTCNVTLTAKDVTPPVITCPANVGPVFTPCGAAFNLGSISVTDNCGPVNTTYQILTSSGQPVSGGNILIAILFGQGNFKVVYTATDLAGNVSKCTTAVNILPRIPELTVTPIQPTSNSTPPVTQYSDNVQLKVTIPGGVAVCNGSGGAVTFKMTGSGNVNLGSANFSPAVNGVDLEASIIVPMVETSGNGAFAPGLKNISVNFQGFQFGGVINALVADKSLLVKQEDAWVDYTGNTQIFTNSPSSSTANVVLKANIHDISVPASPANPAYDNSPGNITNAKVKFIVKTTGGSVVKNSGWLSVSTLLTPGDLRSGTLSYSFSTSIGSSSSRNYTVDVYVGYDASSNSSSGYYIGYGSANITILRPAHLISGNNTPPPTAPEIKAGTDQVAPEGLFDVTVYPNPSTDEFKLKISTDNMKNRILVRVVDAVGRTYKQFTSEPGELVRFGRELKAGNYHVEVIQSGRSKVVKLIKL